MKDNNANEKIKEKALEGAAAEIVDRYSSAVNEHMIAYSGKNNTVGSNMKRGLKRISEYKLHDNPTHRNTNIKQQAGFSFEDKSVASKNADNIVNKARERYVRTDDLPFQKTVDGDSIGGVNDPLFDVAKVSGDKVKGIQLKFVGKNGKECAQLLLGKDYDKYIENDIHIEIPKDYIDDAQKELDTKIGELNNNIERLKKEIETHPEKESVLIRKRERLERVEKTKKLLDESNVTSKEAIEANFLRLKKWLS